MTENYQMNFCPNCATKLKNISQDEEGIEMTRLRCPACNWTYWNNPTPVLAAVVENEKGQVLLARNSAWENGTFGLITGFMEKGESPKFGICREILEETNLKVKALKLIDVYEFLKINQVIITYHVLVDSGEVKLSPELLEYKWNNPEETLCWSSGTGYALAYWVKSKGFNPKFADFRHGIKQKIDSNKWPIRHYKNNKKFQLP